MEYIGGGHLGQLWLDVYGELSDYHLWVYIAGELISAVHCLHSHGIVHRDIKLENVMSRGVRVVDFGLACRLDVDCSRTTIGTRIYRPYNASSDLDLATRLVSDDIWAVGITLHLLAHPEAKAALLLGRPIVVPHSGDRGMVGEVLYNLLEADPLARIRNFNYLINSL
jgi:serine/threonine protein kinase